MLKYEEKKVTTIINVKKQQLHKKEFQTEI